MGSLSTLELVKLGLLGLLVVLSIAWLVSRRGRSSGSRTLTGHRAADIAQIVAFALLVLSATLPVSKPVKEVLRGAYVLAQVIVVWLIVRAPRPALQR